MKSAAFSHLEFIFKRYSRSMIALDVCNEILDGGNLRDTIWLKTWGQDFVFEIFEKARELGKKYNPKVKLFINDYGIEEKNSKSDKMLELATSLKKKGILDAVGFQSHLQVGKFPKGFKENLERFTAQGLFVALTELDIRIKLQGRTADQIEKDRKQQILDFQSAFQSCAGVAKCLGVTIWGMMDKYSWIPHNPGTQDSGEATLFNDDYQPKVDLNNLGINFPSTKEKTKPPKCR